MKINWGMGITISLGVFAVMILFFVIRIVTQSKYNYDLVTEDYYEKELLIQKEIDGVKNANALNVNVQGIKTSEGYLLRFPSNLNPQQIKGELSLYRPSNKALDFEIHLSLTKNEFLIPYHRLSPGRWNIGMFWEYEGITYYFEEKIIF